MDWFKGKSKKDHYLEILGVLFRMTVHLSFTVLVRLMASFDPSHAGGGQDFVGAFASKKQLEGQRGWLGSSS